VTRAFVAIRPPAAVLDAIEMRLGTSSMRGGRPTAREQWHLTVQFLGDDADVDAVVGALASEPLAVRAAELRLGGADALGNPRRARIVALRLCEGEEWMRALAREVQARLAPLGYGRDRAPEEFVPHLTLARFREPTDLRKLGAVMGPEPVGPSWRAEEIVLYESVLRPQGARHVARADFRFA
jgi:RNA 2',3'-cyclic 3'-phosphodiesterase